MSGDRTIGKRSAEVDQFLAELQHPLKSEIGRLREVILDADARISERIKWKAPSFCVDGEDRVTFNLRPTDSIQVVFHRGVKVKNADDFSFEDPAELLHWAAKDRALLKLRTMAEIEAKRPEIGDLVRRWMEATR